MTCANLAKKLTMFFSLNACHNTNTFKTSNTYWKISPGILLARILHVLSAGYTSMEVTRDTGTTGRTGKAMYTGTIVRLHVQWSERAGHIVMETLCYSYSQFEKRSGNSIRYINQLMYRLLLIVVVTLKLFSLNVL